MNNWIFWLVIGIISVIGGIFALFNPMVATLTAERLAGWMFLVIGILEIFSAFREKGWGASLWAGLIGLMGIFVGLSLLANPLAGVISLTIIVAVLFGVVGIAKIIMSFQIRGTSYFWLVLISGVVSLLLAIMIFTNFPGSAATILGILLAVELLSNGVSLIALSLTRKPAA